MIDGLRCGGVPSSPAAGVGLVTRALAQEGETHSDHLSIAGEALQQFDKQAGERTAGAPLPRSAPTKKASRSGSRRGPPGSPSPSWADVGAMVLLS